MRLRIFAAFSSLFFGSMAVAAEYVNPELNFTATPPPGHKLCRDGAPAANRGFWIDLSGYACRKSDSESYISLAASYNVPYEARTTEELAASICTSYGKMSELRAHNQRFMQCDGKSGSAMKKHLFVLLVDIASLDRASWLVFVVEINCAKDKYQQCFELARRTVATISVAAH